VKKNIPLWLVLGSAVLIVAVVGYMFAVRPKRSETAKLDSEVAAFQVQLEAAQKLAADKGASFETRIRVADIIELAKAMPDDQDMAGIVYELNSIAESSGVKFTAIQPGTSLPGPGYTLIPISVTFQGNYYGLSELLYSLRSLVSVRDGVLEAEGRLFRVEAIDFQEPSEGGFPLVNGVLTVSAYQFGADAGSTTPAAGAATTGATTTGAATTGATTTGATTTGATTTTETTPATTGAEPPAPPADVAQQAQGGTP